MLSSGSPDQQCTETVSSVVKPKDYYPLVVCLVVAGEIYIEQQSGKH